MKSGKSQLAKMLRSIPAMTACGIAGVRNHTCADFVDFLDQAVSSCKRHQEIHIILDNLSAHKTGQVEEFLQRNPNAKLRFTPTYSSWLNQVEIWFAGWSAKSSLAASSLRSKTSRATSCATSVPIQKTLAPSNGNTPTFEEESSHANELAATGH
jgi:hypothetical protein